MIRHDDIGPRVFYSMEAAREYRDEMGGWMFCPDGETGETSWFPMSMTPTTILTHRLTAGLSGYLCSGAKTPERINRPAKGISEVMP